MTRLRRARLAGALVALGIYCSSRIAPRLLVQRAVRLVCRSFRPRSLMSPPAKAGRDRWKGLPNPFVHWLNRHRLLILGGICVFVTLVAVVAHFLPSVPYLSDIWRADQSVQDLLRREGRKTATRPDFVFIGIDQESLEFQPFNAEQVANNRALQLMAEKPFPWSREVWALVMDRLFNAGARLVLFDIIFSSPN